MPGLRDTIGLITRLRRQAEASSTPVGGETRLKATADFGANPGALRMLSYLPEGLTAGAPLVVVLHGCTQRAEAYAEDAGWLTLADRYGFAVLAPEQTPANNPNRCFNWFAPEDAARGRGEAASIRAMVAHMLREHGLDAGRVFVTGLSAGGAMTSVMLAAYPDVFSAGAVVAGLPYGVADNVQEAFGAMLGGRPRDPAELGELVRRAAPASGSIPRVSIWHGDADATVTPSNAKEIASQWAAVHGLAARPGETQILPGRTRAVWRSHQKDEVLIESNLVHGLGHGTPLSTSGAEGIGRVAPFMLEAGVSSSLEIVRFWGIADPALTASGRGEALKRGLEPRAVPTPSEEAPPEDFRQRPRSPASVADLVMASVSKHVPPDVQGVIARALTSAGLMK